MGERHGALAVDLDLDAFRQTTRAPQPNAEGDGRRSEDLRRRLDVLEAEHERRRALLAAGLARHVLVRPLGDIDGAVARLRHT